MDYMYDIKDKLCRELEDYARKPDMSVGDLEAIHKLTDTIKNIDKIFAFEDDDDSYTRDDWDMRNGYDRSSSYRGQRRDSRGRYVRERNRTYSRADGKEHMMKQMEMLMEQAGSEHEREAIRRCMNQLENS